MPFRTLLKFRNPDLTGDINRRFASLISKGVFYGGEVLPVAGALEVQVQPFGAVGADGMVTVLESTPETLGVTADTTQYIVLHAEYLAADNPIVALESLGVTAYDALSDADKRVRVRLATVTVPLGATEVLAEYISRVDTDQVDPLARSAFRGVVTTEADLPDYTDPATGETTQNRPDDIYFVQAERIFYHWNTVATPQWTPVIAAATELALQDHKQNQDDGTEPPGFIDAQHITTPQRQAFDLGAASVVKHGAGGTAFGPTNGLVDAQYPLAVVERVDFGSLVGATAVQLVGTFYVGTGGLGTAEQYFRLADSTGDRTLIGSDRNPIVVGQIYNSANVSPLDPGVDADALGFYQNPWVRFSFAGTSDTTVTGAITVVANRRAATGTLDTEALAYPRVPVPMVTNASDIPVVAQGFTTIPTGTLDAQAAFDFIDVSLTGLGANPNELSWYGGQVSPISTLTGDATESVWNSLLGTAIRLDSVTNVVHFGDSLAASLEIQGIQNGETVLPYGAAVSNFGSTVRPRAGAHLFVDVRGNDGNDGVVFRYDSTNTQSAPDSVALAIQGNSGDARVTINDYPTAAPSRNLAVTGTASFLRSAAAYTQRLDLLLDGGGNQLISVSPETNKKPLVFESDYIAGGVASGALGFRWALGDETAPTIIAEINESGQGYSRAVSSATTAITPFFWSFGASGTLHDIRVTSVTPGFVWQDETGGQHDFRLGVQSNLFVLSVDTDSDEARDTDKHFDDQRVFRASSSAFVSYLGYGLEHASQTINKAVAGWQDTTGAALSTALLAHQSVLIAAGESATALVDYANPLNNLVSTGEHINLGADGGIYCYTGLQTSTPADANDYQLYVDGNGLLYVKNRVRLAAPAGSDVLIARLSGPVTPTAGTNIGYLAVSNHRRTTAPGDLYFYSAARLRQRIDSNELSYIDLAVKGSLTNSLIAFGALGSGTPYEMTFEGDLGGYLNNPGGLGIGLPVAPGTGTYQVWIRGNNNISLYVEKTAFPDTNPIMRLKSSTALFDFTLNQSPAILKIGDLTYDSIVALRADASLPRMMVGDGLQDTDGILHVRKASSGATEPTGSVLVLEHSANTIVGLLSGTTGYGKLGFHDSSSGTSRGDLTYNHNTDEISLSTTADTLLLSGNRLHHHGGAIHAVVSSLQTDHDFSAITTTYQNWAFHTIPANTLEVGSTVRVTIGGIVVDAGTAAGGNCDIEIRWNSTTSTPVIQSVLNSNVQTNDMFTVEVLLTYQGVGATGQIRYNTTARWISSTGDQKFVEYSAFGANATATFRTDAAVPLYLRVNATATLTTLRVYTAVVEVS